MLMSNKNRGVILIGGIAAVFGVVLVLMATSTALAQTGSVVVDMERAALNTGGSTGAGLSEQGNLGFLVGRIIKGFLGLLGTVFVVLTIYAGYLWMTASGNEEQITKAKKMITNAVIGLIIILLAYAITDFVLARLWEATQDGSVPVSPG